jgi:hypothetical protein
MERRGPNTWIVAVLAIAVGFLAALLIVRGTNNDNSTVSATTAATATTTTTTGTTTAAAGTGTTTTSTTTTSGQSAAPTDPQPSVGSCVNLWNQPTNRGDQVFLVNVMSHQPIRVHVGVTSDVPPRCLITVVANNGDAYVFPSAAGTTYPYAQAPGATDSKTLASAQKISNALEQRDGTLSAR